MNISQSVHARESNAISVEVSHVLADGRVTEHWTTTIRVGVFGDSEVEMVIFTDKKPEITMKETEG